MEIRLFILNFIMFLCGIWIYMHTFDFLMFSAGISIILLFILYQNVLDYLEKQLEYDEYNRQKN
jgi:hypothetical protein